MSFAWFVVTIQKIIYTVNNSELVQFTSRHRDEKFGACCGAAIFKSLQKQFIYQQSFLNYVVDVFSAALQVCLEVESRFGISFLTSNRRFFFKKKKNADHFQKCNNSKRGFS
jgi:hypothetical protein